MLNYLFCYFVVTVKLTPRCDAAGEEARWGEGRNSSSDASMALGQVKPTKPYPKALHCSRNPD